ncbi:MAG: CBS domain-containing protein [Propionicimonas sp.]|uniref:CBS domain-containing protein n=1 Tax=Propionicimonas sp. TaxID=1955623 RepID=UPI003D0B8B1F
MKIEDIIRKKGADVVTIAPAATVAELVDFLAKYNIGAVVVSEDGETITGIVSERDVVRRLAKNGSDVLAQPVSAIMTADVLTCSTEDSLEDTGHTMTYSRIRHLPVVKDGKLTGIISIGDVVKYRIDQLTDERNHLLEYLHA